MFDNLIAKLKSAQSVVLSTHRNCDGDGLGAEVALYHGLNKAGINTRIINVDRPSKKYDFLQTSKMVEVYQSGKTPLPKFDMALILDTNDERLVAPLFQDLTAVCQNIHFVDHHPLLSTGASTTATSVIETNAASTGEMAYNILQRLNISLDPSIAQALYTSIVFDTQLFRYIRQRSHSHKIAAELLQFEIDAEEIHRYLFSTYTVEKLSFLARAINGVEYYRSNRVAIIHLLARDFRDNQLELDESGDVIDMVMNIESVEAAALIREDLPGHFKISLRSKGKVEILPVAELLGGGGHKHSAGAYIQGDYMELHNKILLELEALVAQV